MAERTAQAGPAAIEYGTLVEGVVKHEGFLASVREAVTNELGLDEPAPKLDDDAFRLGVKPIVMGVLCELFKIELPEGAEMEVTLPPLLDDESLTTLVTLKLEQLLPDAIEKVQAGAAKAEAEAAKKAEARARKDDAAVAKAAAKEAEKVAAERAVRDADARERYQALMTGAPPAGIDLDKVQSAGLLLGDGGTFSIDYAQHFDRDALTLDPSSGAIALRHDKLVIGEGMPEGFAFSEMLLVMQGVEGFTAYRCEMLPPLTAGGGKTVSIGENSLVFRRRAA
jgi:hypothetical protein